MKPSVLFVTKICFLDAALEYIEEVKHYVDLDVIIEIDPNSKDKNIINIKTLPEKITFIDAKLLLSYDDYLNFKPYEDNCKSFRFMVHQQKKSFSISSIKKSFILYKELKKLSPNFIHFDDVSHRLITFSFFLNFCSNKLVMNVHDPIQHSGEKNLKNIFANKMFYCRVHKFVVFSKYSKSIFVRNVDAKCECVSLNLKPYKYYSNYLTKEDMPANYITFIGRVSEYKGIDIFLDAIEILNAKFPTTQYIIAGSPHNNTIARNLLDKYDFKNVQFKFSHLTNAEVCEIIQKSQIIVCPYKDATQSGVVMTALALYTPVVVSNQGGLPEYIQHNHTGMIANADPISFAAAIETFIVDTTKHKNLSKNIREMGFGGFVFGPEKILDLYS